MSSSAPRHRPAAATAASSGLKKSSVTPSSHSSKSNGKPGGSTKAKVKEKKQTEEEEDGSEETFEVSYIVSRRLIGSGEDASLAAVEREMLLAAESAELPPEEFEYFIFWKGYKQKDCTWESYSCLDNCPDALRNFLARKRKERKQQHIDHNERTEQEQNNRDEEEEQGKQPKSKQSRASLPSKQQQSSRSSSFLHYHAIEEKESASSDQEQQDESPRENGHNPLKKQPKRGSNSHPSAATSSSASQPHHLLATPTKSLTTSTSSSRSRTYRLPPSPPESPENHSSPEMAEPSKRQKLRHSTSPVTAAPVVRKSPYSAVVPLSSIPPLHTAASTSPNRSSAATRKDGSEHKSYCSRIPNAIVKLKPQSPKSPEQKSSLARARRAAAAIMTEPTHPSSNTALDEDPSSPPRTHAPIFARHTKNPFARKSAPPSPAQTPSTPMVEGPPTPSAGTMEDEEEDDAPAATGMDVEDESVGAVDATPAPSAAKRTKRKRVTQAEIIAKEAACFYPNDLHDMTPSTPNDSTATPAGSAARPKRVAAATSQLMHQLDFEALDANRDDLKELLMGRNLPVKYHYRSVRPRRRNARARVAKENEDDPQHAINFDSESDFGESASAKDAISILKALAKQSQAADNGQDDDDNDANDQDDDKSEVGVSFIMSQKKNTQYLKPTCIRAMRNSLWLYKIKWDDGSETWEPESILRDVPEARRDWKRRQAIMQWRSSHPNEYEIGGEEEAAAMDEYEFISSYDQDPSSKKGKLSGKSGISVPPVLYVEEEGCEVEEEIDGNRARELLGMVTAADRERIEVEVLTREKFHKEIVNKEKRIQREEEKRMRQLVHNALNSPTEQTSQKEKTTDAPLGITSFGVVATSALTSVGVSSVPDPVAVSSSMIDL